MRLSAADLRHAGAGIHDGMVAFHVGMHRYTATPDEAIDLGRQLIDAAEKAKESRRG